jgi:hypothetical protein
MKNNSLSSDMLEQQFGPSELEILLQEGMTRIICTKATASGLVLELSQVTFIKTGITEFPEAHHAVVAGQSMGKAFRAHEINFRRQVKRVCRLSLPNTFKQWFGSGDLATVVSVSILVGPDLSPYADILEVYSPAVRWPRVGKEPDAELLSAIQTFSKSLQELTL